MTSLAIRALLVLVCGFAALSSSAAAALGLENGRIAVFSGLMLTLLLLPVVLRPRLGRPDGPALPLLLLLGLLLLAAGGNGIELIDAKLVLPVAVLLAAPNLARFFTAETLVRFVWRVLSCYIAVTFLYQVVAEPAVVAHGYDGIVRYDPTGSVVMHSSLSLIHLVVAVTRLIQKLPLRTRLVTVALAAMSLAMIFLTATRTALLTLALLAVLELATAPRPGQTLCRFAAAMLGLGIAFGAWTLAVDDSFLLRLTGGQGDFSSGRWSSIAHWLALAGDHPLGMGLGTVRRLLAAGRPALNGTELLEWPHNEFVRFYVEAGPIGLLFVALLLVVLLRRTVRAARAGSEPVLRALMLAIMADLVAEACLQNLLNAVYHATVLILILGVAVAVATRRRPAGERSPAPAIRAEATGSR